MLKKAFNHGIIELALLTGLFMGCDTSTGQKSEATSASDANAALLSLAVKDSGACLDLKARCVRAHENGNDSQSVVDTLVDSCIVDTATAHRIREGIGGHGGRHGGPGGEIHGPRLDSAARAALCDSLTAALAKADSADSGYGLLKHQTAHVCAEPTAHPGARPGLDSAAAAAICDSLKTVLAGTDSASAIYPFLKHATAEFCEEGRLPMSHEPGFDRDRGRGRHGHH